MKNGKSKLKKEKSYKKSLVILLVLFTMLWGVVASGISIAKIQNYVHPYYFGFLMTIVGLFAGVLVARTNKSFFIITKTIFKDNGRVKLSLTIGFIGSFLLIGHYLNTNFPLAKKCDFYPIVNKNYIEERFRSPELNILIVNIDGEYHKISTSHKFWEATTTRRKINVCYYKGLMGFDYLELNSEIK